MSMRRSQGGSRSSRARTSRPGSGPPSTTIRPPRPPSTRIPSPCPTSRTTTWTAPSGRWNTASASPMVAPTSATPPTRTARDVRGAPRERAGRTAVEPVRLRPRSAANAAAATRSAQRAPATMSASDTAAAATSHGGSSDRLASGSDAPMRTTLTIAAYSTQAGSPTSTATMPGIPAAASIPTTSASAPAAIAAGTSGTTRRFTAGATSDSRPKSRSTIGVVAAWAANDTPRMSAIQRRGRLGSAPASLPVRLVPQARIPAVASTDRRKPASFTYAGSRTSSAVHAQPRAAAAVPGRPSSRASSATPAIAPARTTDGDGPTNAT
jgi:hypothetical protein